MHRNFKVVFVKRRDSSPLRSAMGDLLREDYSLAQKDKPYRCLDLFLKHRDELFEYLKGQWGHLFGAKYDVLLYDLTSTYFESDPPPPGSESKTCPHENGETFWIQP